VDTFRSVSSDLPWPERVEQTAVAALSQFLALQQCYDFIAEGQSSFGPALDGYRADGRDPRDALCFVWYVEASADNLEQV
jgi:hypothetical protein